MNKRTILTAVVIMIFIASETMIVMAQEQSNSTNLDKQKIIVTWLETNDTMTSDSPVISVSGENFWMVFEPLLTVNQGLLQFYLNKPK
jgi:hypothetical protein